MGDRSTCLPYGRLPQATNKAYMLTNNKPELERLDRQHRVLLLAIEALYWPVEDVRRVLTPQDSPVRVLDIGSGSGRWAVEIAKEFPHAEVLGIDLAPKKPSDTPENCRFEVLDVLNNDVSHLQGRFDIVHCRALGGGMRHYRSFLEQTVGMVKPGGLLLDVEPENMVYNEMKHPVKPAFADQDPGSGSWLARTLSEGSSRVRFIEDELPTGLGPSILKWLGEDPRLENIRQKSLYIPIGWQGGDDIELANRDEVGKLLVTSLLELAQAYRRGLLAAGMAADEVDKFIQETEAELLQLRVKGYVLWKYSVARVILS